MIDFLGVGLRALRGRTGRCGAVVVLGTKGSFTGKMANKIKITILAVEATKQT